MIRPTFLSLAAVASTIPSRAHVAFGGSSGLWRRPLAVARELIRQERNGLHIHTLFGGLDVDLLVAAGVVASVHASHVGLDELGNAPHFALAARRSEIDVHEFSEFTFVAGLRAASSGLPFMPTKSAWETDVARDAGWKAIRCPYTGAELLTVPAAQIDVAVVHAERCDEAGNIARLPTAEFIGDFDLLLAQAADRVIVSVERVETVAPEDVGLLAREVDAVVVAPRGAWPGGMTATYGVDFQHLRTAYPGPRIESRTTAHYLDRFVYAGEPA
jgi:glutaconate CoA-transferase subunit A